ncbi:hypothetical protein [Marinimicrobium alkaliphilum]|uniref:hypothetical protein n=1 Tax=Marinimicrobium alkaliphilum TaxID=2202654 RepID=UPI000DB9B292|nr:hypothetical protein [Marinimicrobium alkaliphilum]
MQYTRAMIELVYEIRRRVPSDMKPSIKMANPDMFHELAAFYHQSKDVISKTLIKELFELAGEPWTGVLAAHQPELPKQTTKVYRGQVTLTDSKPSGDTAAKPKRMYRGRAID